MAESLNVYPLPEMVFIPIHEWEEEDVVIVIKNEPAWKALQPQDLEWDIGVTLDAPGPTEDNYKKLVKRADGMGEVIYAVGDATAFDAGKYVAKMMDMPLVCVPAALTSDSAWTWTSAARDKGGVQYLETIPAELLLMDLGLIAKAPVAQRASGMADVLSIVTACADWRLAQERGKNAPQETYDPGLARVAESIAAMAMDCAEAAGAGDPAGLQTLARALAMSVQLNNLAFHSRATEGSEHFFAYCAESLDGGGAIGRLHSDYVAPGVLAMAERLGLDAGPLRAALTKSGTRADVLSADVTANTLAQLPEYVRRHQLPFGAAWQA